MSITTARRYVEVSPPPVAPGGVLSTADIIPVGEGDHAMLGAEYLTDACADGGVYVDFCHVEATVGACGSPTGPPGGAKAFERPELVQGSPFAVYGGVDCRLDSTDNEARALRSLAFSEGRQVDLHMWGILDSLDTAQIPPNDLTSTVAVMEEHARDLYGSYATIHLPAGHVTCGFNEHIFMHGPNGGIMTALGTKIAPMAVPTPGASDDAYVTGRVTLIQGPVKSFSTPEMTDTDGTCTNPRALAERVYVPLIECFVIKGAPTCGT